MAIAIVQTLTEYSVTASATPQTQTIIGVAAGSLLVVLIGSTGRTPTFTVSDDKGNTWTVLVTQINATPDTRVTIAYANNVAAGDTQVTITQSASVTFKARLMEVSGQDTGTVADANSSKAEAATTTHVCAADATVIDTTTAGIVFCVSRSASSFGTLTVGAGYTQITSGAAVYLYQWQVFSGAQANEQGAFTSGNSVSASSAIGAFKEATAGAASGFPTSLVADYGQPVEMMLLELDRAF